MILEKEKYPECKKCKRPFPSKPCKFGCDLCKSVLDHETLLTIRVYFDDSGIEDRDDFDFNRDDRVQEFHFCNWHCTAKWLRTSPKLKTLLKGKRKKVQFIDLPTIHPKEFNEFNRALFGGKKL